MGLRRKRRGGICGKPTFNGTPCKNPSGCRINHPPQTTPATGHPDGPKFTNPKSKENGATEKLDLPESAPNQNECESCGDHDDDLVNFDGTPMCDTCHEETHHETEDDCGIERCPYMILEDEAGRFYRLTDGVEVTEDGFELTTTEAG